MDLTLGIDFGSTYTKAVAIDLAKEALVGVAQSASTVDTDMTIGLQTTLAKLATAIGIEKVNPDLVRACSSAAGGLRLVAVGLVTTLTTKAAEEAALGAGARLVGTFSYGLGPEDVKRIEQIGPDLILLVGGTDGGDTDTILHNAAQLGGSKLNSPVIIAGNKMVSHEAQSLLEAGNKEALVVENVLPELHRLNVEPARQAIRDMFMRRITHAKGLDKAQSLVGGMIMPTPMAVLEGAKLIAEGAEGEPGLGELIVVDVGGATTDIHSVADGFPSQEDVIVKGLPEPHVRRTVEGDLGIRYNAPSILYVAGKKKVEKEIAFSKDAPPELDLEASVQRLSAHTGFVPVSEMEFLVDIGLASTAVDIATQRHAGKIEDVYFPAGRVRIQRGKDLTRTENVLGTGGVFAYGRGSHQILQRACFDRKSPESLRPLKPEFFVDERYILFAMGLLAEVSPAKALRIMKRYLKKV
jgi:uncharacterized protein (TIGR01319 family)